MLCIDLPKDEPVDLAAMMKAIERHVIEQALKETNYSTSKAAIRLSTKRTTLVEKIKRFGIQKEETAMKTMKPAHTGSTKKKCKGSKKGKKR